MARVLSIDAPWSETIRFSNNLEPTISLDIGGTAKTCTLVGYYGFLHFICPIQSGDYDADGPTVTAGEIQVGTGWLRDTAGNPAILTHPGLAADSNFRVDAILPYVTAIEITSSPDSSDGYTAGETIEITVTFNETVTVPRISRSEVSGYPKPKIEIDVGGQARIADFNSTNANSVLFTYNVASGDQDSDGVSIDANKLSLNGGAIWDQARNTPLTPESDGIMELGLDAAVTQPALDDNPSHKVPRNLEQSDSEDEPSLRSYITVVVAEDTSDPDNPQTDFTITWSDVDACSTGYNAYLNSWTYANGEDRTHLGSAAADGSRITSSLSNVEGEGIIFDVELYCGTEDSGRLVSSVSIPRDDGRLVPSTYSSEPPLTALTVSPGTLTPTFHSHTLDYTVADVVANDIRLTLVATAKPDYSVVFVKHDAWGAINICDPFSFSCQGWNYQDGNGNPVYPLTDADADAPGFQVDLATGEKLAMHVLHDYGGTTLQSQFYGLTVTRVPNSPATGLPTINGILQVGHTLTASTSGIADADGLSGATFSYQWLSSRDTEIGGATSSTYTLVADDEGKTVKVRVTFTDDEGNAETRTSAQTAAVAARANSAGICDRTEQVRDNIIGLLNAQDLGSLGIKDCSEVTDEQLTRIRFLDLAGGGIGGKITSLKSGDFEGLSGMRELNLEDNSLSELPEGVFDGLSSLEMLTMQGNDLGSLPEGVFDDLTNLHTLALYDNDLAALPDGVFDGLTKLRTLAISDNELTALSGDVFTGLGGLTRLVASNNKLTSLPDGVFSGMSKLQSVSFSGNPSAPFTLTAELERQGEDGVVVKVAAGAPFAMTVTLSAEGGTLSATTVVIDGGDTESAVVTVTPEGAGAVTVSVDSAAFPDAGTVHDGIQAGVGESLTLEAAASGICDRTEQVREAILARLDHVSDCADVTAADLSGITGFLWVSNNEALTLKSGDFAGLDNLKTLYLYENQLSALPEDVFAGLGSLEELWLSHNQLSELPEDVFDGLGNLKMLRLYENQLGALPEDVFDGLESLESLYLGDAGYGNQLSELPEDVFDGLSNLQRLRLADNELTALPEDVFDGLDSLEELRLFGNQISTLSEDVFDGLDSLEELYLGHNQISTLPEDVFDGLDSLEVLFLNYNQLSELPEDVFDGLGSLESLQLTGNQISVLPDDVFDSIISLRSLGLSRNEISELPDDVFDGLDSLTFLNLDLNQISVLPDDVFTGLHSLTQLLIANNQIAGLPEGVFDGLSQLYRLELNGNQLSELPEGVFDGLGGLLQLWLSNNPGAPFTFTAELEQRGDNVIKVKVAHGVPIFMSVSLSAAGGLLSDATATVAGGSVESDAITVTATGGGEVTVSVESADFVEFPPANINGIQTGLGSPLTLGEDSDSNTPATGTPTISGTAQVGETLTADTSGIADADGLTGVAFTYQWLADDTEIAGATGLTYTLADTDEGKAIKVHVYFTDDAGNDEALTSGATEPIEAQANGQDGNSPATGLPTIRGTAQVGETLTADITGIADADGVSGETFTYQWVSSDGTTDTDITDIERATGPTFTLVVADQGKSVKVRVTFTDGGGNEETLTSAPTGPVFGDGLPGAPRNLTATAADRQVTLSWEPPADNGNPPAKRYRIEWRMDGKDYSSSQWGTSRSTTYTTNDQANLANGVKYVFRVKAGNGSGNSYGPYGPSSEEVSATPTSGSAVDLATPVLLRPKALHYGMVKLDWQDIEGAGWYEVQYYHISSGGAEWLDLPAVGVDVAFHGSSAVVSNLHGLAWLRVRAMSCAGASEWSQIEQLFGTKASDWEGVPVPEVAAGDEIEPCPVVLGTPVLSDPETLHHGMVKLDWQDIEGAGWYVVQYYHISSGGAEWLDLPAVGVDVTFHGSSAVVSNLHGLSWLRVRAMSCAGESEWSQIEQLFGTKASDWEGAPVPEVAAGDEIEPCPGDVGTTDNSPVSGTAQVGETLTSPATGAPAITGTAQVGETLTADTSGIADADGLTNAAFSYQWLADATAIQGATGSTYTLADADAGKAIKVRASFTDDAGNSEALTSAATAAVAGPAAAPLTASFMDVPAEHDGDSAFTLRMAFSEPLSWMNGRRLREDVVAVAGGRATSASRVNRRRDLWQLTVEPHSLAEVTVTLAAGAACGTPVAVCTSDGRALSNTISATVLGPATPRHLTGTAGADTLAGRDGNDVLTGGLGADALSGGLGHDTLVGDDGDATVSSADEGNDLLYGGSGDDLLYGDGGNDALYGDDGASDPLAGNDLLYGGRGDDLLFGDGGDDALYGNAGNDTLDGGAGTDTLTGGAGADTFVFVAGHGTDTITDFTPGADRIDLSAFADLGGLASLTLTAAGSDTVLDLSAHGGGTVRLQGIAAADLLAADFLWP